MRAGLLHCVRQEAASKGAGMDGGRAQPRDRPGTCPGGIQCVAQAEGSAVRDARMTVISSDVMYTCRGEREREYRTGSRALHSATREETRHESSDSCAP